MMLRARAWSVRILDGFNTWFVSDGGVWQTFLACVAAVVFEVLVPSADPHAFLLMAVLTVYSGITQPALARAGRVSGDRQEQLLMKVEALEEQLAAVLATLQVSEDEALAILRAKYSHRHHRKETADDR